MVTISLYRSHHAPGTAGLNGEVHMEEPPQLLEDVEELEGEHREGVG